MPTVELRHAFEWTCDECGRDNFESGVVAEMSQEDRSEIVEDYGFERFQSGNFVSMPDAVVCQHCGAEFETTFGEDEA